MSVRAVVLIQLGLGVPAEKQAAAILAYLGEMGYGLASYVSSEHWRDAVDAIASGLADVIVVAFGGKGIAEAVAQHGGRVESLRPEPHVVAPPARKATVADLMVRLYSQLRSVREVADLTGETTGDIRAALREAGVVPPDGRPRPNGPTK